MKIWGNIYNETHPYAALAKRVNKCGWEKVQSRKFASDLSVEGVLESVEYTWFTDNSAMVILSRIPLDSNRRPIRVSEVLFYGPTTRVDIPPQRPELVLLVNDQAHCILCGRYFCICTNSNLKPFSPITMIKSSSDVSTANGGEVEYTVRSWKDRATIVSKGTKTGLLTIIYSNAISGKQSNITVRQTYTSTFLDQSEISNRIEFHLTRLLSRFPQTNQSEQNQSLVDSGTTSCPPGFYGPNTSNPGLDGSLSVQPPSNFLPKNSSWSDPPKPTHDSPPQTQIATSSSTKQGCYSKPSNPQYGTSSTPNSTKSDGKPRSSLGNVSSGLVLRSIGSRTSEGDSSSRDGMVLNSLCGPEKSGQECLCSAENMPDPVLARILNSRRDVIAANDFPDIPVVEPILESNGAPLNNVTGIPLQSPLTSVRQPGLHELREDDRGRMESLIGGVPFESQSPISTRCGASPMLPSPLPPPLLNQGEPPLKRPRSDTASRSENFGLELDSTWSPNIDDRNMSLPSWSMGSLADRPSSALGRAFGVTRSPSPLPMMSNVLKPLSPSANVVPVSALSLGKSASVEGEFAYPNDPLPTLSETLRTRRDDDITKGLPGLIKPLESMKSGGQFLSSKINDEGHFPTIGDNNNTNDVCCEVCGLSFAKKGNKIRHIQTVHDRLKQFKCDMCDTRFGLKADLNRHRLRIHISRAFSCETCGKSFAEQSRLEHHIKVMHQQETRPFECDICHLRLSRKSSLVRHIQTVHDRTRFRCRFCDNTYSQKFDAVRHERKEHAEHLESFGNEIK